MYLPLGTFLALEVEISSYHEVFELEKSAQCGFCASWRRRLTFAIVVMYKLGVSSSAKHRTEVSKPKHCLALLSYKTK